MIIYTHTYKDNFLVTHTYWLSKSNLICITVSHKFFVPEHLSMKAQSFISLQNFVPFFKTDKLLELYL